ncbi:MAG: C40 family peptidase [Emcibacter sp.]|nr:C40 family peptidase [Emcibacter sp.]
MKIFIMNKDSKQDSRRAQIILCARRCLGVPFRHQGRNPSYGLDCVGLVVYVAKSLGLSDFDQLDYKKIPKKQAISRYANSADFRIKPIEQMMYGDIILLRFGRFLEHAAIVTDRGIIHACEKYGKVTEHGLSADWRSKIISVHTFSIFSEDIKE